MRQLNNSFINKYGYSTLLLQSSIIVLLALFFLLAPSTVLAEELTDNENAENSESFNEQASEDDDTTTEELAEDSESETESVADDKSSTDDQTDGDEVVNSEDVDKIDEEVENSEDADEIDEEEVEHEHDEEIIEEEDSDETNSDETESEDEAHEESTDEDEDEAEDETEKAKSSKEDSTSKQSSSKSTMSVKSNSELGNGDRDKRVVQLKKDLTKLGFGNFPNEPSQAYGAITTKVIKEFQAYYNLSKTGNADQKTLAKINEVLNPPYKNGDRGKAVVTLKKDLTKLGFGNFPNNPSIFYGKITSSVVQEFQAYYKLSKTGNADQKTLDKIHEVLNPPYKNGDRGKAIVTLKKDLTKLGFGNFPNNPSIFYGKVTSSVVKEFQSSFGLSTTGVANKSTLNKISQILQSPYKNGEKGSHVKDLKKNLTTLGFGNFPNNPSTSYGDVTERVIKEFQAYYKLATTGIADDNTLDKIKKVKNAPYENGDRGIAIVNIKKKLTKIGFGNFSSNPSIFYGSVTEGVVKDFQRFFNLKVNGVATNETLNMIDEIANDSLSNGVRGKQVTALKKNLTRLGFGNFPNSPSQAYGSVTMKVVQEFQAYFGLKQTGETTKTTIKKMHETITSPYQNGNKGNFIRELKINLTNLGYGNFPKNPSTSYGSVTEGVVKDFQKGNNLIVNGIGDEVTLDKIKQLIKNNNNVKKIVFLDAGHGGSDPGASGNGLREKDITLDIAKQVKKQLENSGYTVIMSRTSDKYLTLSERTNQANQANADIFVSIHVNAGGGTGIETWMMSNAPESKDSRKLAENLQSELIKETKVNNRGVKDGNLHVNRESKMASALVELGFIDNKNDADKLKLNSFKNKLTNGIVNGIKNFFKVN